MQLIFDDYNGIKNHYSTHIRYYGTYSRSGQPYYGSDDYRNNKIDHHAENRSEFKLSEQSERISYLSEERRVACQEQLYSEKQRQ